MKGISSLINRDMEDPTQLVDENMILASASESDAPKKKGAPKKVTENRINKPKPAPRKPKSTQQTTVGEAASKVASTKRKASEEQISGERVPANKKGVTTTRAQSEDGSDGASGSRHRKPDARAKPKRKIKAKEPIIVEDELSHSPTGPRQNRPGHGAKKQETEPQPPATNPHLSVTEQDSTISEHGALSPDRQLKKIVPRPSRPREENKRRRAGSVSDNEGFSGDPNLRRKLGDVTRKFENIDLRYRNLKEVGITEANANAEKMRKQCEMTNSASTDLITSLKQELRMHMPLAQEARQLQVDLQTTRTETVKYKSTITELEASLGAAQNEIKALQAKLAAARSSTVTVEGAKTPGSAFRNNGQAKPHMNGSAEAAQCAQVAQLKEDLYSDLTGLIVRSVKRTEAGDAYDCIQTGRNGTLHFKLVVEPEGDGRTTSFEEVEFLYTPLLDSSRDGDMIGLLPYYLKEDITFSRHHAAKFYSRVVDALTKKVEED